MPNLFQPSLCVVQVELQALPLGFDFYVSFYGWLAWLYVTLLSRKEDIVVPVILLFLTHGVGDLVPVHVSVQVSLFPEVRILHSEEVPVVQVQVIPNLGT